MSSFARSSRKVAPEPENMTTNNSQTKKLSMIQRLKSFYLNPRSRRIAPAPQNVVGGIKTKFKRKHKRKITKRRSKKYFKKLSFI